jgi:hypothetical protein
MSKGATIATPHPVHVQMYVNTNLALQSSEAKRKMDCEPDMHTRQTLTSLLRIGSFRSAGATCIRAEVNPSESVRNSQEIDVPEAQDF